jgi:uncharacterized protein YaiI (UPF0178 family)
MRILVDADAAPIKDIVEKVAKEHKIEVQMYIDTSHIYESDYSKVITVSKGRDAADYAIIEAVKQNDIVITNDYPLAALALLKGAKSIGFSGLIYTNDNIEILLSQRQLNQKMRNAGKRGNKIKKRKNKDNEKFEETLKKIISR